MNIFKRLSAMRFLLLALLCVALPAMAADRAAVVKLLQGYEWHPDKAAFDKLGADSDRVLMNIASDTTATTLLRGRAMAALVLYPNDAVWRWFQTAISDTHAVLLRRRAVDGMCAAFAAGRPDAVLSAVTPLLAAGDAHLRVRAAQCLRRIGGNKADAALSKYRQGIRTSWEARAAGFSGANKP